MSFAEIKEIVIEALTLITPVVSIIGFIVVSWKTGKVDMDQFKSFILEVLPVVINQTEITTSGAENKKELAVSLTTQLLAEKYGSIKKATMSKLTKYISDNVETILSTPQKK